MRVRGVRKGFSVRDKRARIKAIKQEVAILFYEGYVENNLSRLRELNNLAGNKHFLTHNAFMKKYVRRMYSITTNQTAAFYFAEPYEYFESILLKMFGKFVCLDNLSNEEINEAEEYIYKIE
ncbi:hypothetical protein [Pseudomonas simiae]|uniref:hypothetical protein n=1 Tax=Pseudomonas simiae TaxID=321846 RepID=UPI0011B2954D|nr:hypothetical protein [Pseudomonas simiae]